MPNLPEGQTTRLEQDDEEEDEVERGKGLLGKVHLLAPVFTPAVVGDGSRSPRSQAELSERRYRCFKKEKEQGHGRTAGSTNYP